MFDKVGNRAETISGLIDKSINRKLVWNNCDFFKVKIVLFKSFFKANIPRLQLLKYNKFCFFYLYIN